MSKTLLNAVFIIIGIMFLYRDFKSTSGFVKQKILHLLIIIFLLYVYRDSIRYILNFLGNFTDYFNKSYVQAGILSPLINFLVNLISNLLGSVLFISAIGLLVRNEYFRKVVIQIMPFVIILNIPGLYIGYLGQSTDLSKKVFLIVSIVIFIIYILIYLLYRSELMKEFFAAKKIDKK
ncbi:MAG: hypothetical protein GYA51_03490 [Candidatus Methanofastidiosa archaeon]|nr:hypothetical protein [Candidatus Methanofastidiosa archaeon]